MRPRRLILWVTLLLTALALAGCFGETSNFPIAGAGQTLDITVVDLERLTELRYSEFSQNQLLGHYRLTRSQDSLELVLVRLSVGNQRATTALVDVDEQAVQLRDFFDGVYFPTDIEVKGDTWKMTDSGWGWVSNPVAEETPDLPAEEVAPDPPGWGKGSVRSIELYADGGTPPGQGFLVGSFRLNQGYGVDGWIVFEAPKGTEFRDLRWQAGDSITIDF